MAENEVFSTDPNTVTLEQAKAWLRGKVEDGARCPCCTQFTKRYRRKLYSSMAAALIALYRQAGDGRWVHKKELVKHPTLGATFGGGDFAKLSYWELIEEKVKNDFEDKKTSGWWRITEKGKLFVENKHLITEYVLIYDSRVVGFDGDQIRITDTLSDKFSYSELMRN